MMLLDHCITYLRPVHVDMTEFERWLDLSVTPWRTQDEAHVRMMWHKFLVKAECCIIMGATIKQKARIAELYGTHMEEWYYESEENDGVPIRYTSPH